MKTENEDDIIFMGGRGAFNWAGHTVLAFSGLSHEVATRQLPFGGDTSKPRKLRLCRSNSRSGGSIGIIDLVRIRDIIPASAPTAVLDLGSVVIIPELRHKSNLRA